MTTAKFILQLAFASTALLLANSPAAVADIKVGVVYDYSGP